VVAANRVLFANIVNMTFSFPFASFRPGVAGFRSTVGLLWCCSEL